MSFFLTQEQIRIQHKTVTRRNGWLNLKPGTKLQPIVKGQGLKKGEKVQKIGPPIRVTKVSREFLLCINEQEIYREGFTSMTPYEFVEMYCKANKCDIDAMVTRIEFEYLNDELDQ